MLDRLGWLPTLASGSVFAVIGAALWLLIRIRPAEYSKVLLMDSQKALVRRPSSRLHEGIVDHIERVPVDYELAVEQWEQYVALLGRYGWETIEVRTRGRLS